MPFTVGVDVTHMLQILVCKLGILLGQQVADVPSGLVAFRLSTFWVPANLLGLVRF